MARTGSHDAEVDGRTSTSLRVLLALLRVGAAVGAVLLGRWSFAILSHVWGENDSGLALYLVFASVPGVPAVLLLLALRGWPRRR